MFTPAGEKSRAVRVTRRPRLGATDQPAVPIAGPPSYSYGSPSPDRARQTTTQDTEKSRIDVHDRSNYGAETRHTFSDLEHIDDRDMDESSSQDHIYDRRTPRKKMPSLQDIEASINRRQSLRSGSRSVGRGSPSVASSQDRGDIKRESQEVILDYDVTQSSTSRTYDESRILLAQLGGPSEDSYTDDDISETEITDNQQTDYSQHEHPAKVGRSLRSVINYISETVSFCGFMIGQMTRRISHTSKNSLKHLYTIISRNLCSGSLGRQLLSLITLVILLALPLLYFGLPQFLPKAVQRSSYTTPYVAPQNAVGLVNRVTSLEAYLTQYSQAITDLEKELAALSRDSTLHKERSDVAVIRSNQVKDVLDEVTTKMNAIEESLQTFRNSRAGFASDMKSLTQNVRLLEDRTSAHSSDLQEYVKTGLEHDKDLRALQASIKQHDQYIQKFEDHKLNFEYSEGLEQFVFDVIERALPEKLVVTLMSGRTQSTAEFWQYLSTLFVTRDEFNNGSTSKHTVSRTWGDFLDVNEAGLLEVFNRSTTSSRHEAGNEEAIVSRNYFMDLIRREWAGLVDDLENRINSNEEAVKNAETIAYDALQRTEQGSKAPKSRMEPYLDTISQSAIEQVVNSAIHKFSLDTLASPDYAAYASGSRINPFLTSSTYMHRPSALVPRIFSRMFFNIGSSWSHPPAVAIHPSSAVGMCWAFPGSSGQLSVKLSHEIMLTDVAVEHVHPDIAHDASTAPRQIEIWAHIGDGAMNETANLSESYQTARDAVLREAPAIGFVHVMDIVYNVYNGEQVVQSFPVPQAYRKMNLSTSQVLYRIKSNWGNEDFTCLYRVRAIGRPKVFSESEEIDRDEDM